MERLIYADHSATTAVKKEVLEEMLPYFCENFGNASSVYSIGRKSREAVEEARKKVAKAIGAEYEDEIYFTAGGSEADNMIIKGIARANRFKGNHIITSKIEHPAVINTCKALENEGFEVTYLDVDSKGFVSVDELTNSIKNNTILVSIMFANSEVGTIEPIEEIGKICKNRGVYFHTDAVQVIGNVKINVGEMNIDGLSLSSHKFYGPKGVGAAYIRRGINFKNLIDGGHQENSKRAGTENVPGIVGMGKAIELATANIDEYNRKLLNLRERFIRRVRSLVPDVIINGDMQKRLPGNVNISVPGIDSASMLLMLNMNGICASSGSACTSSSTSISHVLAAIGVNENVAKCALRLTFGDENTEEDIDFIASKIYEIVQNIRSRNIRNL